MSAHKYLLLGSLLWIFSPAEGKELTITCTSSEECVLPCQFQSDGKGARIMWYKRKAVVSCTRYGDTSFVVGHNSPADKYKDRTGLFVDQVLEGNATLLLRNVTPHDQGKYFCITMTAPRTDESGIISLVLKAPVREVDVELSGDSVTCRAEGIFPAPKLTWSTDPPTDPRLLQNKTSIHKNQLGFYNVESSLTLTGNNATNLTYICCVSCDSNRKTVFLKHEAPVSASPGGAVMVSCSLPHAAPQSFNLTWRFRRVPILSISRSLLKVWDQWKPHVSNDLLGWRGLQLHSLKPEHQGSYTCEVSTPAGTYVTWTDVTVTEDSTGYIYAIIGLSYFLVLSYVTLAFAGFYIRHLKKAARQEETSDGTSEALNVEVNGGEEVEEENSVDVSR